MVVVVGTEGWVGHFWTTSAFCRNQENSRFFHQVKLVVWSLFSDKTLWGTPASFASVTRVQAVLLAGVFSPDPQLHFDTVYSKSWGQYFFPALSHESLQWFRSQIAQYKLNSNFLVNNKSPQLAYNWLEERDTKNQEFLCSTKWTLLHFCPFLVKISK